MRRGQFQQGLHGHALAVEVDRQQAPGALGNGVPNLSRIHQKGVGVNVDEHRCCTDRVDCHDCRRCRVRHGDHLITTPDAQRLQSDRDRVGSVVDADTVRNAVVGRKLLLERANTLAQDELTRFEYRFDRLQYLRALLAVFV